MGWETVLLPPTYLEVVIEVGKEIEALVEMFDIDKINVKGEIVFTIANQNELFVGLW